MEEARGFTSSAETPVSPIQPDPASSAWYDWHRNGAPEVSASPVSPIMSRRPSHESDRNSTLSGLTNHFPSGPIHASPAPTYVAQAGAAQVVSEHQASKKATSSESDNEDGRNGKDDVRFSDMALGHVNAFLDQLLYSILSSARSTSLLALRPAVTEVLKHRLAKEAISSADVELAELLAGADEEEEMDNKHKAQEARRAWDLELVWKRTRLRVMVYTRLGEMEDEDEQRYVEREELFQGTESRFSSTSGLVSWSAAIFLTSVIEYVAEQTLQVAGQAAFNRARRESRSRRSTSSDSRAESDVIVEEYDVEKIALNPALGRLWRTWRKALRNQAATVRPTSSSVSRASRENMASAMSHHRGSFDTIRDGSTANDSRPMSRAQQEDIPEALYPEHVLAANIPLPMADQTRDIDEIVAVGLARDPEDGTDEQTHAADAGPYPEYVLAPLVPLPMHSAQKDLDDIMIPGLARDPDVESVSDHTLHEPYPEILLALLVALPFIDLRRDVDEIEVPGLAKDPDAQDEGVAASSSKSPLRRRSFSAFSNPKSPAGLPTGQESASDASAVGEMPLVARPRSMSHPATARKSVFAMEDPELLPIVPKAMEYSNGADTEKIALPQEESAGRPRGEALKAAQDASSDAQVPESGNESSKPGFPTTAAEAAAGVAAGIAGVAAAAWSKISKDGSAHHPSSDAPTGISNGDRNPAQSTQDASSAGIVEELETNKTPIDVKSMVAAGARGRSQSPAELDATSLATVSQELPPTLQTPKTFLDVSNGENKAKALPVLPPLQTAQPVGATNGTQSAASAVERASYKAGHSKQSSDPNDVQEHPVVQKIASLKSSEPSSASGTDKALPVPSAAIRGPEDFDSFVQGGETLKYTLTPEPVREGPTDVAAASYPKPAQSPVEMDATPTTPRHIHSSSGESRTGRSTTPRDLTATSTDGKTPTSEKRRSLARPPPRNTSSGSRHGLMAREPRVITESTGDFADFIRSTGPNKQSTMYPIMPNASSASLHSLRSAHIQGASNSRSSSPSGERAKSMMNGTEAVPPVPPIPSQPKTKLQARGAQIKNNGSSALIDFIRSGPNQDGKHRISRTVAPFRTTMDSDQFNDLSARPSAENRTQSVESRKSSSFRTSTNSRSALLNHGTNGAVPNSSATQYGYAQTTPSNKSTTSKMLPPDNGELQRKQYRNKDPYAIDYDDDDDEDLAATATPKKSKRGGESMLDFLSTHEPPSSGPPQPLIDPNSAHARRLINDARARQNGYVADARTRSMPANAGPRVPAAQSAPPSRQTQTSSKTASQAEARAPTSKSQSRSTSFLNTKALADFIRNTGPPDDPHTAPAPSVGRAASKAPSTKSKKKRGGFFGLGRRNTYLDMP